MFGRRQKFCNWWSWQNKLMKVIWRLFSCSTTTVAKGLSTSSFSCCLKPFEIAFHVCRLLHFSFLCLQKQQKISADPCLREKTSLKFGELHKQLNLFVPISNLPIYLIKCREGVLVFMFCAFNSSQTKQQTSNAFIIHNSIQRMCQS